MPHEPKKRHSRQRQGKRRSAIKLTLQKAIFCPNCNTPTLPHTICKKCGFYKGKQVITIKQTKKEDEQPK